MTAGVSGAAGSREAPGFCTHPPDDPNCFLDVADDPFFAALVGGTDGTSTALLSHPEPGKFCLSGTLDAGPDGEGWGTTLVLSFTDPRAPGRVTVLDGNALGIASVAVTLENPPESGVGVVLLASPNAGCTAPGPECHALFTRITGEGLAKWETSSKTVAFELSELGPVPWGDTSLVLDSRLLRGLVFNMGTSPGERPIDYAFCVKDVEFLRADGTRIASQG